MHSSNYHVIAHLEEKEFVRKLAEKYQATPSEHQALNALREEIMLGDNSMLSPHASPKSKKTATHVIDTLIDKSQLQITGMICLGR